MYLRLSRAGVAAPVVSFSSNPFLSSPLLLLLPVATALCPCLIKSIVSINARSPCVVSIWSMFTARSPCAVFIWSMSCSYLSCFTTGELGSLGGSGDVSRRRSNAPSHSLFAEYSIVSRLWLRYPKETKSWAPITSFWSSPLNAPALLRPLIRAPLRSDDRPAGVVGSPASCE